MKKGSKEYLVFVLVAFTSALIGTFMGKSLHKDCPMSGAELAIHLHAGEEMPQYCACRLMPAEVLPVQVYTYGEDGKLLSESPQPREACFRVVHRSLWHDKLVFFRWKDEMSSPESEE